MRYYSLLARVKSNRSNEVRMKYVLAIWFITHMHVFELHPKHPGAEFYSSFEHCQEAGEAITSMLKHARYRCVVEL